VVILDWPLGVRTTELFVGLAPRVDMMAI
jgi:hypothetical protein